MGNFMIRNSVAIETRFTVRDIMDILYITEEEAIEFLEKNQESINDGVYDTAWNIITHMYNQFSGRKT